MAEDSDLERTEPASPRRLEKAREEGQVARSRELSTFALLAAGVGGLWALGDALYERFAALMRHGMQFGGTGIADPHRMVNDAVSSALAALWALLPLLGLLVLAALLAPMLLGGWLFSTQALAPKFSRLDPLKGLGRMFSSQGLAELLKAIAKTVLVGGVSLWAIARDKDAVFALMTEAPGVALPHMGRLVALCCACVVGSLLLVALLDVPYQLWQHHKRLRMTREELRQESKESEGDPHLKAHIRALQRRAARRRMMAQVPKADVVVANPAHFAVALRYRDGEMRAPRVIAKGADRVALRIRELAAEHGVPVLEAPPLARALYRHAELGDDIPAALYSAVAEVLAWVYQLRRWRDEGGREPSRPEGDRLPVPAGLDPLAEAGGAARGRA